MALQCYYDAIEKADTTDKDCDYAQLSRVYGQMAGIYYDQGLYRQGLYQERNAVKYGWLGSDTLAALMSYEQEYYAYAGLDLSDSLIYIIKVPINANNMDIQQKQRLL